MVVGGYLPAVLYGMADKSGILTVDNNRSSVRNSDVEKWISIVTTVCSFIAVVITSWSWDRNSHGAETILSRVTVANGVSVRFYDQWKATACDGANPFGVLVSVLISAIVHRRE